MWTFIIIKKPFNHQAIKLGSLIKKIISYVSGNPEIPRIKCKAFKNEYLIVYIAINNKMDLLPFPAVYAK